MSVGSATFTVTAGDPDGGNRENAASASYDVSADGHPIPLTDADGTGESGTVGTNSTVPGCTDGADTIHSEDRCGTPHQARASPRLGSSRVGSVGLFQHL